MTDLFHIGVSSDFKTVAAGAIEPVLARILDPIPYIEYEFYDAPPGDPVSPETIAGYDAVIVLGTYFDAGSFTGDER